MLRNSPHQTVGILPCKLLGILFHLLKFPWQYLMQGFSDLLNTAHPPPCLNNIQNHLWLWNASHYILLHRYHSQFECQHRHQQKHIAPSQLTKQRIHYSHSCLRCVKKTSFSVFQCRMFLFQLELTNIRIIELLTKVLTIILIFSFVFAPNNQFRHFSFQLF